MHPLPVELPAGILDGPAELPCELVGLVDAEVQPASSPSHEGDRYALSGRVGDLHTFTSGCLSASMTHRGMGQSLQRL